MATAQSKRSIAGIEELLPRKEQVDSLFTHGSFLYPNLVCSTADGNNLGIYWL